MTNFSMNKLGQPSLFAKLTVAFLFALLVVDLNSNVVDAVPVFLNHVFTWNTDYSCASASRFYLVIGFSTTSKITTVTPATYQDLEIKAYDSASSSQLLLITYQQQAPFDTLLTVQNEDGVSANVEILAQCTSSATGVLTQPSALVGSPYTNVYKTFVKLGTPIQKLVLNPYSCATTDFRCFVNPITNGENTELQIELTPFPTSNIVDPVDISLKFDGSIYQVRAPFAPTSSSAPLLQLQSPSGAVFDTGAPFATFSAPVLVQGGDHIRVYLDPSYTRQIISRFVPLIGNQASTYGILSMAFPSFNTSYALVSQTSNTIHKQFDYNVIGTPANIGGFTIPTLYDLPLPANWATYSYSNFIPNLKINGKPVPTYPFGMVSPTSFEFQMLFPPYNSINSVNPTAFHNVGFQGQVLTFGGSPGPAGDIPIITNFTVIEVDSYTAIVSLQIESDIDYYQTKLQSGLTFSNIDLAEGNFKSGRYESLVRMPVTTSNIITPDSPFTMEVYYVYNKKNQNSRYFEGSGYLIDQTPIPRLPFFSMSPFSITSFEFSPSVVDVTAGPATTTLYFACGQVVGHPKIQILQRNYYSNAEAKQNIFEGYYDPALGKFAIPITLRQSLFPGPLEYILWNYPVSYTPSSLASLPSIQTKAYLNITSNYADMMGPIVTEFSRSGGPTTITTANSEVSWTFTITDNSGFSTGTFYLTSSEDPRFMKVAQVSYADRISGDLYSSTYTVTFRVNLQYKISKAVLSLTLTDVLGNQASSLPSIDDTDVYIDPFIYFLSKPEMEILNLYFGSSQPSRISLPSLNSMALNSNLIFVGGSDRTFNLTFSVDFPKNYDSFRPPYIYLNTLDGDFLSIPITNTLQWNTTVNFTLVYELPYGFGTNGGILISLYGITDVPGNIVGYSSGILKTMGMPYYVQTSFNPTPLIESTSLITNSGGKLTIYGRMLGPITRPLPNIFLTFPNSIDISGSVIFASSPLLILHMPSSNEEKVEIKVENDYGSTSYTVYFSTTTTPVVVPTPTPIYNPNSCQDCSSSNGRCENGVCICTPPYSGYNCKSQIINTTSTYNPTNPATVTKSFDFTAGVAIVGLREIDISGNIVKKYDFGSWNMTNNTASTYQTYSYVTAVNSTPVPTSIQADVNYYTERSSVQFGSKSLIMDPFTLKYTISIAYYPFQDKLNYLQVVLSANVEPTNANSCSGKQVDESQENQVGWVKLRVDDKSLYGRFIDTAILDGKETKVVNSLLDQNTMETNDKSSSNIYFIGINVPQFQTVAMLDPDFSVLLDEDTACGSSGLTTQQKIGIIIASVGGFLVISIIAAFIIKRRYGYKFRVFLEERKGSKEHEMS